MGSVLGWSPSPQFFATHVYAAAKSAVIGFTKSCAAYYAPHNIRFNVIAPAAGRYADGAAGGGRRSDSGDSSAPSSRSMAVASAGRRTSTPRWCIFCPTARAT